MRVRELEEVRTAIIFRVLLLCEAICRKLKAVAR